MKLRMIDRLLAALAGLMLLALAVVPLADTLFNTGILVYLNKVVEFRTPAHLAFMLGGGAAMVIVGLLLLYVATRRMKRKGFVVQSTDVGELSISIRAIEDLVNRCVEKHEELHVSDIALENTHDGLVIKLRISLATGVNIPLAVTALQKQVKQYVTACSGVDVNEIKVQVETSSAIAKPSVYAVPDMLENPQPLLMEPEDADPEPIPAEVVEEAAIEVKEPEEKCLHQRLFGEEDQPAIVPAPPAEEGTQAEMIPEEQEAEAEAKLPADELIQAWEKAEEEAAEAASGLDELDTLSGLSEDAEEAAEAIDCVADEKDVAELAALDGAEITEEA